MDTAKYCRFQTIAIRELKGLRFRGTFWDLNPSEKEMFKERVNELWREDAKKPTRKQNPRRAWREHKGYTSIKMRNCTVVSTNKPIKTKTNIQYLGRD